MVSYNQIVRRSAGGRRYLADQRNVVAEMQDPNSRYWQQRTWPLERRLKEKMGEEKYEEWVESLPEEITYREAYHELAALDKELAVELCAGVVG